MGKITVETCEIEGLKVITPTVFGDARGYFMETYNYNDFKEAGIDQVFVQDNQSASSKESWFPVSSHANPRPKVSTCSVPRRRYSLLMLVISISPLAEGFTFFAISTTSLS